MKREKRRSDEEEERGGEGKEKRGSALHVTHGILVTYYIYIYMYMYMQGTIISGNVSHVLSFFLRKSLQSNMATSKWQLLVAQLQGGREREREVGWEEERGEEGGGGMEGERETQRERQRWKNKLETNMYMYTLVYTCIHRMRQIGTYNLYTCGYTCTNQ